MKATDFIGDYSIDYRYVRDAQGADTSDPKTTTLSITVKNDTIRTEMMLNTTDYFVIRFVEENGKFRAVQCVDYLLFRNGVRIRYVESEVYSGELTKENNKIIIKYNIAFNGNDWFYFINEK